MPFDKKRELEWRERLKKMRREKQAKRRAALAGDPRVKAMKLALKERLHAGYEREKERRKAIAAEQKRRRHERKTAARSERDAALKKLTHPATDDER